MVAEWWWESTLCFIFGSFLWETAGQVVWQGEVLAGDAVERGEQRSVGVRLLVAQAQRVSALACTQATCLVLSYLTTHREERGAVPFSQKGRASPHGHELSQCRGNAQGYWDRKKPRAGLPFFLFSAGQAWRRSRVLGCCRLSVSTLKANNDPLPAAPQLSQQQPQEQGWLLVISAHRLAIQSCVSLLHAFVVFISVILKV